MLLAGSIMLSVSRVWLQPLTRRRNRGRLPAWPVSPEDDAPSLVVGELHHPTVAAESERPSWLVIPEKGLYTGLLVVGAVGTGKTTACMYPFARQLLTWRAGDAGRRAGALVLEVKGDFCHQVRRILTRADREDDYLEIGLGGSWQWNPLDDPLLDVYRCTVDAELFARKIGEAKAQALRLCPMRAVIAVKDLNAHREALEDWDSEQIDSVTLCGLYGYDVMDLPEVTPAITLCAAGSGIPRIARASPFTARLSRETRSHLMWIVVDAFLDAVKDTLARGDHIEIRGFGTFKVRHRKARTARNPRTGEPVEVPPRVAPVFKPSSHFRSRVDRGSGMSGA